MLWIKQQGILYHFSLSLSYFCSGMRVTIPTYLSWDRRKRLNFFFQYSPLTMGYPKGFQIILSSSDLNHGSICLVLDFIPPGKRNLIFPQWTFTGYIPSHSLVNPQWTWCQITCNYWLWEEQKELQYNESVNENETSIKEITYNSIPIN